MHDWRRHEREQYERTIDVSVNVLRSNQLEKVHFKAETVDISRGGLGIVTDFDLDTGFVKFAGEVDHDTGIVVWCRKVGKDRCRAGIRFVHAVTKAMKYHHKDDREGSAFTIPAYTMSGDDFSDS